MEQLRSQRLNIRLSPQEWEKVHRFCANSTCRSVSEYARKLLTRQPITQLFRNPSLEELNARLPFILEHITAVANGAAKIDPKILDVYGNVLESVEDIRTLLTKLNDQCDPK